jgi:N-acetylmuramoyl-L-alanine amidase
VVAIDAGHGGQDPGAISLSGAYEKQITLAMARALREELKTLHRYKAVLTRNSDRFIRLRDRIAIAHAAGADLFISLHADTVQSSTVRGLSVYTLSERASDAEAAALAERENKVDLIGGIKLAGETPEVTNILIDLIQRETMNDSSQVASMLVSELDEETLLLPRTHRFAGFAVLKAPDVPSVLIELGYLSNPADERLLLSSKHRRKLAQGIARAIDGYFVRVEARNR